MNFAMWSARRVSLVLFLIVVSVLAVYFFALGGWKDISFAVEFDNIRVRQLGHVSTRPPRLISVEVGTTTRKRFLGATLERGGPFDFMACKPGQSREVSVPSRAALFHLVDGQLTPVAAAFDLDRNWTTIGQRDCLRDVLVLDVEIARQERYCVDLVFDYRGSERSEQTCWDFIREVGVYEIPLIAILLQ